jgi:hypothetical protein
MRVDRERDDQTPSKGEVVKALRGRFSILACAPAGCRSSPSLSPRPRCPTSHPSVLSRLQPATSEIHPRHPGSPSHLPMVAAHRSPVLGCAPLPTLRPLAITLVPMRHSPHSAPQSVTPSWRRGRPGNGIPAIPRRDVAVTPQLLPDVRGRMAICRRRLCRSLSDTAAGFGERAVVVAGSP